MRQPHGSPLLSAILGLLALLVASGAEALSPSAPPCDAATPCDCGDRVTANKTLNALSDPVCTTVCPGVGLFVADGVTLNLNGCTITGDGIGSEVGIMIEGGASNVVIQNGRVTGFHAGIDTFTTTTGSTVADLRVYGNSLVGILLIASSTTLRNNVVGPNGGPGVVLLGWSASEDKNAVRSNRADGNEGPGFIIQGSMDTVSNNVSLRNGGCGFEISGDQTTLMQNRAEQNLCAGFLIDGSRHTLRLNHSLRNEIDGYAVFSTDTTFDRNRADYNGGFGIFDDTAGGGTSMTANTYTGNKCSGNGEGKSDPLGLC